MLEEERGYIDYDEEGSGPTILLVPDSWGIGSAWRRPALAWISTDRASPGNPG